MTWSQAKGWFFWTAFFVGIVPMTVVSAFLVGVNISMGWNIPNQTIFLIFWAYHNLYVLAWIFCLDDGLELKFLLDWRPKIGGRVRNPFGSTLETIHAARRGEKLEWFNRYPLIKKILGWIIAFKNKIHISFLWLKRKNLRFVICVLYKSKTIKKIFYFLRKNKTLKWLAVLKVKILRWLAPRIAKLGFFLAAAFIPMVFKTANVYCAVHHKKQELLVWAIITQTRILAIFFGSSFVIGLLQKTWELLSYFLKQTF